MKQKDTKAYKNDHCFIVIPVTPSYGQNIENAFNLNSKNQEEFFIVNKVQFVINPIRFLGGQWIQILYKLYSVTTSVIFIIQFCALPEVNQH